MAHFITCSYSLARIGESPEKSVAYFEVTHSDLLGGQRPLYSVSPQYTPEVERTG
jgi:hypothetical protein